MARAAVIRDIVQLMAIAAAVHRGYVLRLLHHIHFRHIAVALRALKPGLQVGRVTPVHPAGNAINAHPRDGSVLASEAG